MFTAIFHDPLKVPLIALLTVTGAAFIAVSIEHFSHDLQPRGVGTETPGYDHISGPTLAEMPASAFVRQSGEMPLDYVGRMTRLVHFATYHCDPTDHSLSIVGATVEKAMIRMGRDPQRALGLIDRSRLRCGYCSERSIVLADILSENGLDSSVRGLAGHVTTLVVVDGSEYLADPDYGVGPYPYDLQEGELQQIYHASSIPSMTNIVVPIVYNQDDDEPYYSQEFFTDLGRLRSALFTGSTVVASAMAAAGLLMLFTASFIARARRNLLRNATA